MDVDVMEVANPDVKVMLLTVIFEAIPDVTFRVPVLKDVWTAFVMVVLVP
jgi:hypothetical protein